VPSLLSPSLPYMGVYMMAEGAIVSHGPVLMCLQLVRCCSDLSDEGEQESSTSGEPTSGKSSGCQCGSRRPLPNVTASLLCLTLVLLVRGHPSVSLLPLSSPTLHLFICIHPPHLCTILKDHIHSQRLLGLTVCRLPTSPSACTSTALDGLRMHWDRSV
jgi:hypothetical protein